MLSLAELQLALIAVNLFVLAVGAGYFALPQVRPTQDMNFNRSKIFRLSPAPLLILSLAISLCAAVAVAAILQQTGFSLESLGDLSTKRRVRENDQIVSSGGELRTLVTLFRINVYVLIVFWFFNPRMRGSKTLWVSAIISGIGALISSFLLSERGELVLLLLPLMGILVFANAISLRTVIIAFLSFLLFSNIVLVLRNTPSGETITATDILDSTSRIPINLVEAYNGTDVTKIGMIMNFADDPDHLMLGKSFVSWPIAMIPRRLWPSKPKDLNLDYYITENIYHETPEVTLGVVPPSLCGELFFNFSWPGIAVGGAFYGFLLRLLSARLASSQLNEQRLLTYFIVSPAATYLYNMTYTTPVALTIVKGTVLGFGLFFLYRAVAIRKLTPQSPPRFSSNP
ncbi:oligosaccharide repeat unit polymerase [Aporhodopirellula aestuarii]|nr:oligosaccharide repeat unit polymerase [Aporhodopirellula aestuarii]